MQHFVWPGINFSWQAQYLRQVEWKNRKTHWYAAVSAALNFKEVSQNCFDFDVVKCKNWGRLAELLRFLCCQLWKMKRSRRIASFLRLLSSNIGEVSQNCFVFDIVNFENEDISQNSLVFKLADRQVDRQTDRERDRYSRGHPVGRDFPAYCIWKLAKFGWYSGFWFRGLWVGVLNLSQLTPPVSRKSYRDNRWIIFHLLSSAYCIRFPDGLNCPRSQ